MESIMVFFELFAHNPTILRIPAGQTLFREGDADGGLMYVLSAGNADIVIGNRVVEHLQHGGIVGELGLVSPGPRSATVLAISDCEFVAIDEARFQFLIQNTPFFAMQVMRVMAERLRATDRLMPVVEEV
ncbi:MAG TPA: cyclic nucleotide-binding domain-containing protein [Azonexus sp.]|nr:cyclic nucleotide-binding domain-containing protein [Azonexus sp.]